MRRKEELVTGETYHIFNKSIAGFKVFNNKNDFSKMLNIMRYYQLKEPPLKLSEFMKLQDVEEVGFAAHFSAISQQQSKKVRIIAYCLMPTHFHLILKQLTEKGISTFVGNILNSYVRSFNLKYKRKGPLWEAKFKNIRVEDDGYLSHLTRYIHLNPTSVEIVNKPEDWKYSSYTEYINEINNDGKICEYSDILDVTPGSYKTFVEDRIGYQKDLEHIKHLIVE